VSVYSLPLVNPPLFRSPLLNHARYDSLNRLATVSGFNGGGGTAAYAYDGSHQRVYSKITNGGVTTETFFFYGADGKKLGVWTIPSLSSTFTLASLNTWFGGRLLKPQDRLSSIGKYFPYGEDRTNPSPANPPNGQEKFATYTRDAETGLDYAYQRYYTAGLGRFMTPDFGANPKTGAPQNLNRYAYVTGDPTNTSDPTGMDGCSISVVTTVFTGPSGILCPDGPSPSGDPSDITANFPPDISACLVGSDGFLANANGSGCGGSSPAPVSVAAAPGSASQPCTDWCLMPDALTQALLDLKKPGCAQVFAGGIAKGHDPATVLQAIVSGTKYGFVTFAKLSPLDGAVTDSTGIWKWTRAHIVINTYNDPLHIYWNAGNASVNALYLLHELGHAFNDLFGKGSSKIVVDVLKNCDPDPGLEGDNTKALLPCAQ